MLLFLPTATDEAIPDMPTLPLAKLILACRAFMAPLAHVPCGDKILLLAALIRFLAILILIVALLVALILPVLLLLALDILISIAVLILILFLVLIGILVLILVRLVCH